MSAVVTRVPAGNPSSTATSAGPWDSPAVSQRNTGPFWPSGGTSPAHQVRVGVPAPQEYAISGVTSHGVGNALGQVEGRGVTDLDRRLAVLDSDQREDLVEYRSRLAPGLRCLHREAAELVVRVANVEHRDAAVDPLQLDPLWSVVRLRIRRRRG